MLFKAVKLKKLLVIGLSAVMMTGLSLNIPASVNTVSTIDTMTACADDEASVPEYKTWKQFGESWSSMYIGNTTIAKSGCAVVSLAMLCVHSGAVAQEGFDPGVLITALKSNGAFSSSGAINWSKISSYTSNLQFKLQYNTSYSSKATVINLIKSYMNSGYYPILRVNNNGSTHFVCVDYVTDDEVYIMDPGKSTATKLFETYGGITGVRLFTSTTGNPASLIGEQAAVTTTVTEEVADDTVVTEDEVVTSSARVELDSSGQAINIETDAYLNGTYTTIAALNFRETPGVDSTSFCVIPKNTEVEVTITTINGWGRIEYNGQEGWICLRYVR